MFSTSLSFPFILLYIQLYSDYKLQKVAQEIDMPLTDTTKFNLILSHILIHSTY